MVVCICAACNEEEICKAVANGARTLEDLQNQLGVCLNCQICKSEALKILQGTNDTN